MDFLHELDFALEQIELAHAAAEEFVAAQPYELRAVFDRREMCYCVQAHVLREPPPRLLSLIGTSMNSMRQALDYLAMRVVERHGVPKHPERISFPIFISSERYHAEGRKLTREASAQAQAVFEQLQPFRGTEPAKHSLWVLHELQRYQKHRKFLTTGANTSPPTLGAKSMTGVTSMTGVRIDWLGTSYGPFRNGATIARFRVTRTGPIVQENMDFGANFTIAFSLDGPAHGSPVVTTLTGFHLHIQRVILPALLPFV